MQIVADLVFGIQDSLGRRVAIFGEGGRIYPVMAHRCDVVLDDGTTGSFIIISAREPAIGTVRNAVEPPYPEPRLPAIGSPQELR